MAIGVYLSVVIIRAVHRLLKNQDYKIPDILVSLIFAISSFYLLWQGGRNAPAVSRDVIEGKYTTSLEISHQSRIDNRLLRGDKYYISGTTLDGTEITFEVSSSTYVTVIILNKAEYNKG